MTTSLTIILSVIAGFSLGISFFVALKINNVLFSDSGPHWPGILLHIFRFGVTIWAFWAMASFGTIALLSGSIWFLIGRYLAKRMLMNQMN